MKKLVEAKRKLSNPSALTSTPAGTPAITTSMIPYSTKVRSRPSVSTRISDRDGGDSDDGGRH